MIFIKMRLKAGLYILCCSFLLSLVSCLGSDDPLEVVLPDDAELLSFGLSNDSIPELAKIAFTIDQVKGLIYNHDSLKYLTKIDTTAVVKYTNSNSNTNVLLVTENNDSIRWLASGDTLNISKPFRLKVFSLTDASKTKIYQGQINIHQVDPDSIQYRPIASVALFDNNIGLKTISMRDTFYAFVKKPVPLSSGFASVIALYKSLDMIDWEWETMRGLPGDAVVENILQVENKLYACTENGEFYMCVDESRFDWVKVETKYPVVAIAGYIKESNVQTPGLALIVEKDSSVVFAFTPDLLEWKEGSTVAEDFPMSGFSIINYASSSTQYLTLVGENSIWSTQDGVYWAKIRDEFPKLKGCNAFQYNDELYLMNGQFADETYNTDVYYSLDKGINWKKKENKYLPPSAYFPRKNASLTVDSQGVYFYITGGKNDETSTDIWQGFLNKKTFAR